MVSMRAAESVTGNACVRPIKNVSHSFLQLASAKPAFLPKVIELVRVTQEPPPALPALPDRTTTPQVPQRYMGSLSCIPRCSLCHAKGIW